MRMSSSVGYALSAAAAISLLAGCSGSGSVAPTQTNPNNMTTMVSGHTLGRPLMSVVPPWIQAQYLRAPAKQVVVPAKKKKHHKTPDVFVSSFSDSTISCYDNSDKKGTLDGTITAGVSDPQGMAALKGVLYVAMSGGGNISEFSGECGSKAGTVLPYTDGEVAAVTVSADNTVYGSTLSTGHVVQYVGNTGSGTVVGDSNLIEAFFITVNAADTTLCVDGFNTGGSPEVDCAPVNASTHAVGTFTNTGITLAFPGGLVLDNAGNLVADSQGGLIQEYSGITNTPTANSVTCNGSDCVEISMGKGDKNLFAGDAGTTMGEQYDFGGSGSFDFGDAGPAGALVIGAQPVPGQ